MLKHFIHSQHGDIVFNRNSFRRFIYVAFLLLIINYIIIAFMYFKLLTIQTPPNFATTSDGRLINVYQQK